MIELVQYPDLDAATALTRKVIDRINADRIAGKVAYVEPEQPPVRVKREAFQPAKQTTYPNPPATYRECFDIFYDGDD